MLAKPGQLLTKRARTRPVFGQVLPDVGQNWSRLAKLGQIRRDVVKLGPNLAAIDLLRSNLAGRRMEHIFGTATKK